MLLVVACSGLPEVDYETERLEIATDFDHPVCEGSLLWLDEQLGNVEDGLGEIGNEAPIRLYWMGKPGLLEVCGENRGGCFFPGTRVMFARAQSITHEMTHAVLDSEGESYFVEEGLAEVLSGVGVYHNPQKAQSRPAERLRLSRSAYRRGGFDYGEAAHFMRYIYDSRGVHGVSRLADEVQGGASPDRLEDILQDVMGASIEDIEADYLSDAPKYYPGLGHERVPSLSMASLQQGVRRHLSCSSDDTLGPLPDERAGVYQVYRIDVPRTSRAELRLEGDTGSWVDIFNPGARLSREVPDWILPDPAVDPDAIHLEAGQTLVASLERGTYLVMMAAQGVTQARMELALRLYPARWPGPSRLP